VFLLGLIGVTMMCANFFALKLTPLACTVVELWVVYGYFANFCGPLAGFYGYYAG
jgi:hypothetical protein